MSEIPAEPSAEELMWRDLSNTMAEFNERMPPTVPGEAKQPEDEIADKLRECYRLLGLARGPEYPGEPADDRQ